MLPKILKIEIILGGILIAICSFGAIPFHYMSNPFIPQVDFPFLMIFLFIGFFGIFLTFIGKYL